MPKQQSLNLRTWGGKRRGAGRKSARARAAVPHTQRDPVSRHHPVHVTLRMADHVWNLRSERSFRVIDGAFRAARRRPGFRIVHFTILGNHVHMIVEADNTPTLRPVLVGGAEDAARGAVVAVCCALGERGAVLAAAEGGIVAVRGSSSSRTPQPRPTVRPCAFAGREVASTTCVNGERRRPSRPATGSLRRTRLARACRSGSS